MLSGARNPITHSGYTPLPERNLDLFRALGTVTVASCHIIGWQHMPPFLRWFGEASVLAFFIHTAVVLMSSLERDGAPDVKGWVRRFYLRRAFRIFPLAWAVILIVVWWQVPYGLDGTTYHVPSLATIWTNLALVQNIADHENVFGVLWTLPIEVQMYLVLPLCFVVVRLRSSVWTLLLLVTVVMLTAIHVWDARQAASAFHIPGLWRLGTLEFAGSFVMGTIAYRLLRQRAGIPQPLPAWTWLPMVVTTIGLMFVLVPQWLQSWPVRLIYSALVALMIPLVRDAGPGVLTRLAHTIATYSYGIYLTHLLAVRVAFDGLRSQPLVVQWITMVILIIVASYLAYHVIEKPGIALGRWFATGRLRRRVVPTPLEALRRDRPASLSTPAADTQ